MAKLKDPVYHVSTCRLSIRNIPTYINEKELKDLLNKHGNTQQNNKKKNKKNQNNNNNDNDNNNKEMGDKFPLERLNLFRDKDVQDANGKPKSKGYAFACFKTHESALKCLRTLNNNPQYFSQVGIHTIHTIHTIEYIQYIQYIQYI